MGETKKQIIIAFFPRVQANERLRDDANFHPCCMLTSMLTYTYMCYL